jgi:hypothetical protein
VISILLQAFGRKVFAAATIVASIGVLSPIPAVAQSVSGTGAVFVMTNAADNNQIIAYSRDSDGKLTDGDRFDTGGRGSGGLTAPLGSQGSLTLSLDHTFLFAVNAGSGTISVFRVRNSKELSANNCFNFWVGACSSNRRETCLSGVGVRPSADQKP